MKKDDDPVLDIGRTQNPNVTAQTEVSTEAHAASNDKQDTVHSQNTMADTGESAGVAHITLPIGVCVASIADCCGCPEIWRICISVHMPVPRATAHLLCVTPDLNPESVSNCNPPSLMRQRVSTDVQA